MTDLPPDLDGLTLEQPTLEQLRARRSHKWVSAGPDELPAFVADMDVPALAAITDAVQSYAADGDFGYGDGVEEDDLRSAHVGWMQRRHGWAPDPDRIVVTLNVMRAITGALAACTEPGDAVVVSPPVYPPFFDVVTRAGRRVVENPLRRTTTGYELDVDHLRTVAPQARAMLVCNPQNPTGRVLRRDELEAIADIAATHDLTVISDEIHQDLVVGPHPHIPFASLDHPATADSFTATSASKTFSFAGLGCGVLVTPDVARRERVENGVAFHFAHPPVVSIRATTAAWRHGDTWLGHVIEQLRANSDAVTQRFADLSHLRHVAPEGTYLHWLDVSTLELGDAPAETIRARTGVVLTDGAGFGTGGAGHVRLNAGTPPAVLAAVLDRLEPVLRPAGPGRRTV